MPLIVAGVAVLVASGLMALAVHRWQRLATLVGALGAVAGCAIAAAPLVRVLGGQSLPELRHAWSVPVGALVVGIDPLTAFFLAPLFAAGGARRRLRPRLSVGLRGPQAAGGAGVSSQPVRRQHDRRPGRARRRPVPGRLGGDDALVLSARHVRARGGRGAARRLGLPDRGAHRRGLSALAVPAARARLRAASSSPRLGARHGDAPALLLRFWRWSASASRPASCRCTSGCPRRTRPRRRTSRR